MMDGSSLQISGSNMATIPVGRLNWPDVMKLLAIWMVFFSHSKQSGELGVFMRDHSVEIFFFCSGFFALHHINDRPVEYIKLYFRRLIIPYIFFSVATYLILPTEMYISPIRFFASTLLAMRGHTLVATLWFLPALFCEAVLFYILYRFTSYFTSKPGKQIAFLIALILPLWSLSGILYPYIAKISMFGVTEWKLPWSFDSVLEYLPFYAAGAFLFPFLEDVRTGETDKNRCFVVYVVLTVCAIWTFLCILFPQLETFYQPFLPKSGGIFCAYALKCILAWPIVFTSVLIGFLLNRLNFLATIGRQTFLFCCLEMIFTIFVFEIQKIFGFHLIWSHVAEPLSKTIYPIDGICFSILEIVVIYFIFVPFFRDVTPWVCGAGNSSSKNK